jgi:hypothetical protein
MLDLFGQGEERRVDLPEPASEAGQRADVRLYRGTAEVFEQVVVEVHPVHARLARKHLLEIRQVIVDKMGEWLRWVHA